MRVVCQNCGHVGEPSQKQRGSTLVTIILLLFWILPGVIYYIWRSADKSLRCDSCHSLNVIPADTEAAKPYLRPSDNLNVSSVLPKQASRNSMAFKLGKTWGSLSATSKGVTIIAMGVFSAVIYIFGFEARGTQTAIVNDQGGVAPTSHSQKIEECQIRGIAYFSEMGSFPFLSDGRDAAEVAKDRCKKTLTAF